MVRLMSLLLLAGLVYSGALSARSLELPITLRQTLLERIISDQLFSAGATRVRVWDDGRDCNSLELAEPELSLASDHITIRSLAYARVGTAIAGRCLSVADWQGVIEVDQVPTLGIEPGTVQFRVTDSRVLAEDGESAGVVGAVWDWVKQYVQPHFERLQVDINPLLNEIRQVLPLVYADQPAPILRVLEGIRLGAVELEHDRLQLLLQLSLPPGFIDAPEPTGEAPLTAEELARWHQSWQQWDAFLTHFIRQAGEDTVGPELRTELLVVLIEARRDLLPILTQPTHGEVPVAQLFVATWQRLQPLLLELSEQLPAASALNYLTFMTAADMLVALNALEAQTGFTLNADALRRLARMANPAMLVDPLQYSTDVDPELRRVFGFGAPLPHQLPQQIPPQSSLQPTRQTVVGIGTGYMLAVLPLLALQDKHYLDLVEQLNSWVPTLPELDEYLPLVQQLLDRVVGATLNERGLAKKYIDIYRPLVLATAWQESCWRQYVKRDGEVQPIRSPAGAVGIMQINQHVWRGFYEIDALRHEVGYNALAGAEIVYHYLVDYAIAHGEHKQSGGLDNLARSTYSMYNGGPSHRNRYRRDNTSANLRAIDQSFWEKYQLVQKNDPLVVAECYTG